jgi:hypothetical protein
MEVFFGHFPLVIPKMLGYGFDRLERHGGIEICLQEAPDIA